MYRISQSQFDIGKNSLPFLWVTDSQCENDSSEQKFIVSSADMSQNKSLSKLNQYSVVVLFGGQGHVLTVMEDPAVYGW